MSEPQPNTWRFLDTGAATGSFNMAVDETLLDEVAAGNSQPVMRLYRWNPPAVSLGYHQVPERELRLERCHQAGIEVVRRPTGGRAVLHWHELTYSVICRETDSRLGGRSLGATYREIGQALVRGLSAFGVAAVLHRPSARRTEAVTAGPSRAPSATASRPACFATTARWEVTYDGRKLVGSAQRRVRGAILQHGSILTGPGYRRLEELLHGRGAARPASETSCHLRECMTADIDYNDLSRRVKRGFEDQLQTRFEEEQLSGAERNAANRRAAGLPIRRSG